MGGTNDNYPTTVCHLWSKMDQNWENRLKDFLLTGKKMGCSIAKCFYTCHVTWNWFHIWAISPVKQHHFDLIHQVRRWVSAFFLALVLFSHCEIRRHGYPDHNHILPYLSHKGWNRNLHSPDLWKCWNKSIRLEPKNMFDWINACITYFWHFLLNVSTAY